MVQVMQKKMTTAPLWSPTLDKIEKSQLTALMKLISKKESVSFASYDDFHDWSINNLEKFWSYVWDDTGVVGDKGKAPYLVNEDKMLEARFFPTAQLNYAENLLQKTGTDKAIVFRAEKNVVERQLTWNDLQQAVSRFQQFLIQSGVTKGDRVCGFMPNMPETIIALLATASLGAVWSSASPDFGAQGVLDRFGQISPKIMIAVEGYFYNGKVNDCLDKIKEIVPALPSLEKVVLVNYARPDLSFENLGDKYVSYNDIEKTYTTKEIKFTRVAFNHPLFIMYSSGTTGIPKCIVHATGGALLQLLKEHKYQCDIRAGDNVFYFTTCGWMMWNWLVNALALKATVMLYDGSPFYPDGNVLWSYAQDYKFKIFGTSAKFIDALKKHEYSPMKTHDLSDLGVLASTGSPLVPESFDYIYSNIKKDLHVASISGGTDIISCFVLGNPISPVYRGEIQGAGLGMAVEVFDDNGKPLTSGQGELVCTKPFPSMPVGFWNDDNQEKYKAAYFENYDNIWCHGDWVEKTENGGFIIHGRSDATLNPGGVRIGTAEIYRQVEKLSEVVESIAVGQDWKGDVRIILFVVLKAGITLDKDLIAKIKNQIKEGSTPRHVPAKILQVNDIPRTKSGKITEIAVRHIIHGRPVKNVEALANPTVLEEYKNLVLQLQDD